MNDPSTTALVALGISTAFLLIVIMFVLSRKYKKSGQERTDGGPEANNSTAPKRQGFGCVWIVILVILACVCWFAWQRYGDRLVHKAAGIRSSVVRTTVVKPATERLWEYILEKPPGAGGVTSERVLRAKAILLENDEILSFRVYYNDLDETETTEFFLDRGKETGVWKQRKPASEGDWQLATIQTIPGGYCLRINRSETPNQWANAFLIPK